MASRQGLPTNPRAGRSASNRTAQRLRPQEVQKREPEYTKPKLQPSSRAKYDYDEGYDTASSYTPPIKNSSYQSRWAGSTARKVDQPSVTSTESSEGSAVWNKVVGVANNLTISVSKAWASNVTKLSGEDTPPGGESRLTRAMKAYHLEKATSPTDLPAWLFDERERRARPSKSQGPATVQQPPNDKPYVQRGLRHIYDSAASTQVTNTKTSNHDRTPSKATDRLKALRDAKKGARRNLSEDVGRSAVDEEPVFERETRPSQELDNQSSSTPPRRRMGLPSGPRRF